MTTNTITAALLDALTAHSDDTLDDATAALADLIIDLAPISLDDALRIMTIYRIIDPTFSAHAAIIRDTIRDNTDYRL